MDRGCLLAKVLNSGFKVRVFSAHDPSLSSCLFSLRCPRTPRRGVLDLASLSELDAAVGRANSELL